MARRKRRSPKAKKELTPFETAVQDITNKITGLEKTEIKKKTDRELMQELNEFLRQNEQLENIMKQKERPSGGEIRKEKSACIFTDDVAIEAADNLKPKYLEQLKVLIGKIRKNRC